jgi:hypothetical protein
MYSLKLLFAAPVLLSATPDYVPDYTHHPMVKQLICAGGRGSAFRIGRTSFISVSHVTSLGPCTMDGVPITAVEEPGDFAIVEADIPRISALRINCEGFKAGEYYWATGYARGLPWQLTVRIKATGEFHPNGMAVLVGRQTVIPGMSGGAVRNSAGEVVGAINMFNPFFGISLSRELRDTSVCRGAA